NDIKLLMENHDVSYIFMGEEEYEADREYLDSLSENGVNIVVSAAKGYEKNVSSRIIFIPKPIYSYHIVKLLNEGYLSREDSEANARPDLTGIRALVVDDEPMNLVVATGLFRDYGMILDTAASGGEALEKYAVEDYDVIFMDHMMPEMDGITAAKRMKEMDDRRGTRALYIALTANAVSGARQMFMAAGFDGFISKPIDSGDFERVIKKLIPHSAKNKRAGEA
ncbi:MAG: response regulator, partial [Lachnospiraceae bacterium]|nr:response regulator [Lachnospiraceae bacterium]